MDEGQSPLSRRQIFRRRLHQLAVNHGLVIALGLLPSLLFDAVFARRPRKRWPDPTGLAFDRKYGVDTSGVIPLWQLAIDAPNWIYGFDYQGVEVLDLHALLAPLNVDYSNTVFVDLGAGKGRVVMFASLLPFKRVLGVELSNELVGIAERNLDIFARSAKQACSAAVIQGDAAAFSFPPEPLVIFMYNPFTIPVMSAVVANLRRSAERYRRRVLLVYFRPELAEMWRQAEGFGEVAVGARFRIFEYTPCAAMC